VIYRLIFLIFLSGSGCAGLLAQEHGTASYYSNRLHGRRMSDGTRYHKDSLTCAHRRYPLGTMLKVTNIKNGKTVVVKVTDRCGTRRMIDLSYAAAKKLDIIRQGLATVRVERYVEKKGIPFKEEPEDNMPELDFEVTEGGKNDVSEWPKPIENNDKEAKKAPAIALEKENP